MAFDKSEEMGEEVDVDLTKNHVSRAEITELLKAVRPRNLFFYQRAFTHKSVERISRRQKKKGVNVKTYTKKSNETLEFLGDAILSAVVSHYLFKHYPDAEEGLLTRVRSKIVRTEGCALFARKLEIGKYILINPNIHIDCESDNILENTFEALVGAVFLDLGFEFTSAWITHLIEEYVDFKKICHDKNYKDILLRYTQLKKYSKPNYIEIKKTGPPYNCTYCVAVKIIVNSDKDYFMAYGIGQNKKKAEQKASENMLIKFNQKDLSKIANRDLNEKKVDRVEEIVRFNLKSTPNAEQKNHA